MHDGGVRALSCAMLALICMFAVCGGALADSDAFISAFDMDAVISRTGALEVTEKVTYNVTDNINGFTRDIDPSFGTGISDFTAAYADGGTLEYDASAQKGDTGVYKSEQLSGGLVRYYIFAPHDGGDEVTLIYRYRLDGVCRRYADVGVLDMPLLGDSWSVDINEYTANLSFECGAPKNVDIRINSSGMEIAKRAYEAGRVIFEGRNAGEGMFSVRLMFPQALLSGMTYTENTDMAASIRASEAQYDALKVSNHNFGLRLMLTIFVLCAGLMIMALRAWGRDPNTAGTEYHTGTALPEVQGATPAEVGMLLNDNAASGGMLSATLLDLARRGYINMSTMAEGGMAYERMDKPVSDLSRAEGCALDAIMTAGSDGKVSDKKYASWQNALAQDTARHEWFRRLGTAQKITGAAELAAAIGVAIYMAWCASKGAAYDDIFMFMLPCTFALLTSGIVTLAVKKRTQAGAELNQRWKAVKRWLKGEWRLEELNGNGDLLEKLMVYALALGCEDSLARRLDAQSDGFAAAMRSADKLFAGSHCMGALYGSYCSHMHDSFPSCRTGGTSGAAGGGGGGAAPSERCGAAYMAARPASSGAAPFFERSAF